MKIISGNSNPKLAADVSKALATPILDTTYRTFNDGELFVEIRENVRGADVFIIQSTSKPVNDNLMELAIAIDAAKRGSASRITAVVPYFGYARQDRKTGPRTPITAKLVANIISSAGADRVLTFDLHSAPIQGFFDIPVDNLYASPLFATDIKSKFGNKDIVVISPDVGGVARTRELADRLDADIAIVDKRRLAPGLSKSMNVIGDVENKICILVDDIIDSGGTLCNAALALTEKGAQQVIAYVTHGVFAGSDSVEKVDASPISELVVTDTILETPLVAASSKIRTVSIAPLMAEALKRINNEQSVSTLFN